MVYTCVISNNSHQSETVDMFDCTNISSSDYCFYINIKVYLYFLNPDLDSFRVQFFFPTLGINVVFRLHCVIATKGCFYPCFVMGEIPSFYIY